MRLNKLFSDSEENCGHCGGSINSKDVEIIGNIYEHKHLLDNTEMTIMEKNF